jgi:hypothetical protein
MEAICSDDVVKAGQILVSETVHNNIHNKPGISYSFHSESQLRNVEDPVMIYTLDLDSAQILEPTIKAKKLSKKAFPRSPALATLLIFVTAYFLYNKYWHSGGIKNIDKSIAVMPFKSR